MTVVCGYACVLLSTTALSVLRTTPPLLVATEKSPVLHQLNYLYETDEGINTYIRLKMNEKLALLNSDDFDSIDKLVWERPMTLALIQEYKRFEPSFRDPSVKKKLIWKNIAACLHAQGYTNVTNDACDKKWRNLKKTFKDIYTGQRRKNNGKWAYYDILEEVLGKDPKIMNALITEHNAMDGLPTLAKHPVIHKYKTADGQNVHVEVVDLGEMSHILNDTDDCRLTDNTEDIEDEGNPVGIICQEYNEHNQAKVDGDQRQQPPMWFAHFLNEYRENEERRLELLQTMHEDVLAMETKKVTLLEQLLDKLSSSSNDNSQAAVTQLVDVNEIKKHFSGL